VSNTINKADLVGMVADKTEMSKTDAAVAVDAMLDAITSVLQKGMEVRLVGFGTFHVTHRKAGEGRNPQTGATIQIPASNQPKFKAGKALKDAIN
jgi:DNA-binding protein HU-beta